MSCNNISIESQVVAAEAAKIIASYSLDVVPIRHAKLPRVPIDPSILLIGDAAGRGPEAFRLSDVMDNDPVVTIVTTDKMVLADVVPSLVATALNDRFSLIVWTTDAAAHEWRRFAGKRLVHVAVNDIFSILPGVSA